MPGSRVPSMFRFGPLITRIVRATRRSLHLCRMIARDGEEKGIVAQFEMGEVEFDLPGTIIPARDSAYCSCVAGFAHRSRGIRRLAGESVPARLRPQLGMD